MAVQYFEGRIRRKTKNYCLSMSDKVKQIARHSDSGKRSGLPRALPIPIPRRSGRHYNAKSARRKPLSRCWVFRKRDFPSGGKWAAVAAIVLLTVGGTLGVRQLSSSLQPETYFVCETPYGEKSKVVLSDGTVVWLNAGSTLKYSNKFNTDNRRVELNGEGYFEVTKKEGATFIVQTHGYDVVVKGTKFDVSAYDDDPFISTTLLEGSVELNYKGSPIRMSPGESMRLNVETGKFIRTQVNASQSKAWAENRIEFDHITLKELVAKLSRQYDVNIRLESEAVGDKTFRISLRNRETIGEVMTALQEIIPITVERKGKDIYIRE